MLKRIICGGVIALLFIGSNLISADASPPFRNYGYSLASPCDANVSNCYNAHYYTGSEIAWFPNWVAYMNIGASAWNMLCYSFGARAIKRWNKDVNEAIELELASMARVEQELGGFLAQIIKDFKNGIGEGYDVYVAEGIIERLTIHNCSHCIDEFVQIVSNSVHNTERENRRRFKDFAASSQGKLECKMHKFSELPCSAYSREKDLEANSSCHHLKSAFWDKWNHPMHISSIGYVLGAFSLTVPMTLGMDTVNRAGAFVGDLANCANIIVIPTAYLYSLFQQWMSLDRTKAKSLEKEIIKRFTATNAVVEIAARAIGEMENGIKVNEARGFIKALMLVGWPKELVEALKLVASNDNTASKDSLIQKLTHALREKDLPYNDDDIDVALQKTQGNVAAQNDTVIPII